MNQKSSGTATTEAGGKGSAQSFEGRSRRGSPSSSQHRLSTSFLALWGTLFSGADPGQYRLLSALRTVLGLGIALGADGLFVHFLHPLDLDPGIGISESVAASVNHGLLVLAMSLGAVEVLITSNAPVTTRMSHHLRLMAFAVALSLGSFAVGVALGGSRVASFAVMIALLTAGSFVTRFGPAWGSLGPLAFAFDLSGFFSHGLVSLDKLGWCGAFIAIGAAAEVLVRYGLLRPDPRRSLRRTQHSFDVRATRVSRLSLALFDDPDHDERKRRRLSLALSRMNEAALMIDAQLGTPGVLPADVSAVMAQQRLFDLELALSTCGRLAPLMGRVDMSIDERRESRDALVAIVNDHLDEAKRHAANTMTMLRASAGRLDLKGDPLAGTMLHRFASAVEILADTRRAWDALGETATMGAEFRPAVTLVKGALPGAAGVTATASRESGWRRDEHVLLGGSTRLAIQVAIAATAAIALGDLLSGRRFYWALIAVFIVFLGTSHSGEQVRKAVLRVVGTAVGVVVGSLLAQAVGGSDPVATIAIILLALFAALYLIKINYVFMVIGMTITLTQLYEQLGEFSDSMLVVRLEEQAIGAAVALMVVIFVLPMRTNRVLRIALRHHLEAVGAVLERATSILLGVAAGDAAELQNLRNDARAVDVTYHSLLAITAPVRRTTFGGINKDVETLMRDASATQRYCANLVADVSAADRLDPVTIVALEPAIAGLRTSLAQLTRGLSERRHNDFARSSGRFDQVERQLERSGGKPATRLVLRDLSFLDATLSSIAQTSGFAVANDEAIPDAPIQEPVSLAPTP